MLRTIGMSATHDGVAAGAQIQSLLKILVTAETAMGAGEMLSLLPPHWTLLSLKAAGE